MSNKETEKTITVTVEPTDTQEYKTGYVIATSRSGTPYKIPFERKIKIPYSVYENLKTRRRPISTVSKMTIDEIMNRFRVTEAKARKIQEQMPTYNIKWVKKYNIEIY